MDADQPVRFVEYRVAGEQNRHHDYKREGMHKKRYEITVRGQLEGNWTGWFNGMDIRNLPDGDAVLCGEVVDQAALHGLLIKIRDLGLPLVSVNIVRPGQNSLR